MIKYEILRDLLVKEYNITLVNGFINQDDQDLVIDYLIKNKDSNADFEFWSTFFSGNEKYKITYTQRQLDLENFLNEKLLHDQLEKEKNKQNF